MSSASSVSSSSATGSTSKPASTVGPARAGALAAALCYFSWGLVPLYWKQLAGINALELIAHRHVWSLLFLFVLLAAQGGFAEVREVFREPRTLAKSFVSALFLTGNWLIYVWGVNQGQVIECSLGYFLVPLVNVAAARFVLHEQLSKAQWLAIGCAAAGVVLMIIQLGHAPWIALSLAATWGAYSLMRKQSKLGAISGLTLETLLLAPLAVGFLLWQHHTGEGALGRVSVGTHVLVLSAGVITAIPLLLFAFGARRIRLSTLGLLQYLAPSVQLALGVWVYREPFPRTRMLSFSLIWLGLILYTVDNVLAQRRKSAA